MEGVAINWLAVIVAAISAFIVGARPRNLWAHREDISSRQAAKNAKDSAALFGRDFKRQCQLVFLASLRLGESKKN